MAGADGGAAWDRIPARPQASLRVAEFSLTPASSSLEAGVATSRARPKLERLATADSSDTLPESCTIRLAFGNSDAPSGRSLGGIGFSWRKAFIVAYFRRTILRRCSIRKPEAPATQILLIPPPPNPPSDIDTFESIDPPWPASREWIPADATDPLAVFPEDIVSTHWVPKEIRLDDERTL